MTLSPYAKAIVALVMAVIDLAVLYVPAFEGVRPMVVPVVTLLMPYLVFAVPNRPLT